jgi:DNA polymerase I-like protein with 3'-5' exonuclease and polymerase domains
VSIVEPTDAELPAPRRAGGSVFRRISARYIVPATTAASGGLRLDFDVEADGLLDTATKLHCIVVSNLDSNQVDEYGPEQIPAGLDHLSRADYLIGHNICNYDLPLLRRLHGWAPKSGCAVIDTMIASRLILPNLGELDDQAAAMGDPKLGKLRGRHSIEAWGLRLGIAKPGTDIEDWSQWTPEMQARCPGDVAICKALFKFLQPAGYSPQALELEHRVAPICAQITAAGISFDVEAAEGLKQKWTARRAELEAQLLQQFPGTNLNSRQQIAALLEARGWAPEKRTAKKGQPKIDDEVLESIPAIYPEFAGLAEHFTLGRRLGQLSNGKKAWLKNVGADGRIHGKIVSVGTPHSRAAHLGPNLAAVPNPKRAKPFAAECRSLFKASDGWVLVTCDQATLQDRAFGHYLAAFDDGAYAQDIVNGIDRHWRSAAMLGLSAGAERDKDNRAHNVIREGSKGFYYGFLFGAQNARAGRIIYDTIRAVRQVDPAFAATLSQKFFGGAEHPNQAAVTRVGKAARDAFMNGTPGLRRVCSDLEKQARRGWLDGLDGRRVPVRALYTALNYAVTSVEAVVCKRWLCLAHDELFRRFRYGWNGDVVIVLWIHDEIVCCCRPEIAKEVGEILVRHAKEPGEFYGLKVPLDADFKICRNWAGEPIKSAAQSEPAPIIPDKPAGNAGNGADHDVPIAGNGADHDLEPIAAAPEPQVEVTIKGAGMLFAAAPVKAAAQSDEVPPWIDDPPRPRHSGNGRDGFDDFVQPRAPGGKILCPFHDDHMPSLHVYPDEDDPHYHCFVCGAHGRLNDLDVDWRAALKSPAGKAPDAPDDDNERNLARAHELWAKAEPIADTLAERYLAETRGIDVGALPPSINDALRFDPRCWLDGKHHPCLIALFRDIETGERAGIHRTWLTPDVQKIDRRMFGRWPRPRAIKLWPADDKLCVGEGIETVLAAATRLHLQPAWALGPRVYLEKLPIISGVNELTILVDRDAHGEAAAAACRQTWKAAGRRVRQLRVKGAGLKDFNDLVCAKLRGSS